MQAVIDSAMASCGPDDDFNTIQAHCEIGVVKYFKVLCVWQPAVSRRALTPSLQDEMRRLGLDGDAAMSTTTLLSDSAALNAQGLAVKVMKNHAAMSASSSSR